MAELFNIPVLKQCLNMMGVIGKHTLYIFLYHLFVLFRLIPLASAWIDTSNLNIWVRRVIDFAIMIAGSIAIEVIITKIIKLVSRAYVSENA